MLTAVEIAGVVMLASAGGAAFLSEHAFGANPTVSLPPGPFSNGQTITVSGSGFPPRSQNPTGLQIIECSDPQGTRENLPADATGCEGITVSPAQINSDASGRFTTRYRVAALSSAGAGAASSIDCDATHQCVLWVGVDYNGAFIGGPHAFSSPFAVTGTAVPTSNPTTTPGPASAGNGPASTPTPSPTGASAGTASRNGVPGGSGLPVSGASGGTLAYTGVPGVLPWTVGFGVLMTLTGAVGRRLATKRASG
jgi:hypothetical protein